MRRREFITLLGGAAASWPIAARAQQATKQTIASECSFRHRQRRTPQISMPSGNVYKLGYVEGRNLVIDYRSAEGQPDRFPVLAAELVNLKADLIMTRGTPAALAAKSAHPYDPGGHGSDWRGGRDGRRRQHRAPGR